MKKLIAIILSAVMLLSLVPAAVLAAPAADEVGKVAAGYTPVGKGIASLAEATDPAGSYYLTADITVSATLDVTFTGTIDGNGKTITVSAPVFTDFSGTLKNAVIAGAIDESAAESTNVGTVGRTSSAGATFENVKNTATVKAWLKVNRNAAGGFIGYSPAVLTFKNCANTAAINGYCAGGLVGYLAGAASEIYAEGCTNSGAISDTGTVKVKNAGGVGGLVGLADSTKKLSFKDCHNTADISGLCGADTNASNTTTGGILGYNYIGKDVPVKEETFCIMENVSNTGKITGTNQVGGIAGYVGAELTCTNAVNKGEVISLGNYAAGIVSRVGGDTDSTDEAKAAAAKYVAGTFKNCENYGKVVSYKSQAGGILAYTSYGAVAESCVNRGEINMVACTGNAHLGGIFGSLAYTTIVKNCANYGAINGALGTGGHNGGLVGRSSITGKSTVLIENSINFGNVKSNSAASAAGISSYVYGGTDSSTIRNCINAGKVESTSGDSIIAGAVAYYNTSAKFNIQGFVNAGELVLPEGGKGYKAGIAYNKHATLNTEGFANNYCSEADGAYAFVHNSAEITKVAGDTYTAADLASGKLCYELNKAIGKTVFYQTIGTDKTPTTSSASNVVYLVDGAYTNTAPAAPSPAPTGDGAFAIVLALVAVSCGAVLTMKKAR